MTGRITCAIIFSMFAIELINAQTYNVTVGPNSKTRQAIPIDIGPCDAMLNITPETPWKLGSSSITSQDDNLWSPGSKIASMHTYNMVNAYSSREYVHIEGKLTQNGSGEEPPPPFDVTVPAVDIDWVGYEAKTDEGAFGQEVEYYNAVACQITTNHNEMREFVVRPPYDDYSMFQNTATLRLLFNSTLIYVYDKYNNHVSSGQNLTFSKSTSKRTYHMSPKDGAAAGQEFFISVEGTAGADGYKPCDAIRGFVFNVDIDKIAFNYKLSLATGDALNIRENYTTAISIPEYVKGGRNKPVAYIRNKAVKILVRLKVQSTSVTSLKIKGISDDTDGSLGNAAERTVTFSGGISQEGVDDASTTGFDESEYVEFTINGNTPNKVFKSEEAWRWIVTEINGTAVPDIEVERTSGHKVYTIFADPYTPWSTAFGNTKNPWTNVLEYACGWASGAADEGSAVGPVTTGAYSGFGKEYDGSQYHTLNGYCELTAMLVDTVVDCKDMSAVVELFTRVLGGTSVQVRRVNGPFMYKSILPIGKSTWSNGGWSHHQFGWHGGKVYDACLMLKQSAPYVPVGDDISGNYKNNLYDSRTWTPQTPHTITSFD